ncbi:MAG: serine/threonine-protein kinase, partial [Myxococcota bacterium]
RGRRAVSRFFHEAKATSALGHPGIVSVFDFGFYGDGRAYLTMEFLAGESLRQRIARRGPMAADQVVALTRHTVQALAAAHAQDIVHRDLKPGNLMVVPDPGVPYGERIKVLDFGIAKVAASSDCEFVTVSGQTLGTPAYMAPEQIRSPRDVDGRADLYALGCIMFHMLCGQPPFTGSYGAVLSKQLFTPPPAVSALVPDVAPELDALILRLMAKDPAARLADTGELLNYLDELELGRTGRDECPCRCGPMCRTRATGHSDGFTSRTGQRSEHSAYRTQHTVRRWAATTCEH